MAGWVYNSYRNLGFLHAQRVSYTPASAAVQAVLPVVNDLTLWPVLIELWKESDPWRLTRCNVVKRFQSPWPIYVLLALVLAGIPPAAYALYSLQSVPSLEAVTKLNNVGILLNVISCLQAGVLLLIVNRVTRNQSERHAVLSAM